MSTTNPTPDPLEDPELPLEGEPEEPQPVPNPDDEPDAG